MVRNGTCPSFAVTNGGCLMRRIRGMDRVEFVMLSIVIAAAIGIALVGRA
jgi:hypothetical protein